MNYIDELKYLDNYINIKFYLNLTFILYIKSNKNYEKYSIEFICINNINNKKNTIYKTSILSLAVDIFNKFINNNLLFLLDSKERKNWMNNHIMEIESDYYKSLPKTQIKKYTYTDYDKVELTFTQEHCKYVINGHMIKLAVVIRNTRRHLYCIRSSYIYYSDDFINTSKAYDYIVSLDYIYELYIGSVENNDIEYLNIINWVINDKYLSKLKNKFELYMRNAQLFTFCDGTTDLLNKIDEKYKKIFSENVLSLLPSK